MIKASLRPRPADIIIIALILIIAAASALPQLIPSEHRIATITIDGAEYMRLDLDNCKNRIIEPELICNNKIEIRDGKIGIISADCPDQTCVGTGFIFRAGQSVVCIPSRLVITISGDDDYDIISGMAGWLYG